MKGYKFIIALINFFVIILILFNLDLLMAWVKEEKGSVITDFLTIAALAAVPGIPFGMVSGMIGAKYGVFLGGLMSVFASTLAAALIYVLFRFLLQQQGAKLLSRYKSLKRLDQFLKSYTFWSVLTARIIPVMPAAVINIYAGVFGLSFKLFLLSTLLGKVPVMFAFTLVGDSLHSGTADWIAVFFIYVLFLLFVYGVYRLIGHGQR